MKKFFVVGLALLALGFIFTGCDPDGSSDLPVSTIRWEVDKDGFTQYYTNDPQYYGYSSWALYNNGGKDTYEIECKKMSGFQDSAYGLVFGASNTEPNKFYTLFITVSGGSRVMKMDGDKETYITDWTEPSSLLSGYNKLNTLKVTKSGSTYTLFINNTQVHQFTDSSISGQRIGFYNYTSIEANEKFPNSPVDVRFRFK